MFGHVPCTGNVIRASFSQFVDFVLPKPKELPPEYIMEVLPVMDLEQARFNVEESSVSSEVESSEDPTTTLGEAEEENASKEEVLAQAETKAVNRSKLLVYFVLLIAAGAVGAASYIFTSNELEDDFENEVNPLNIALRSSN